MKYYDKGIDYINGLPEDVVDKIPLNYRIGCQYIINNRPVSIFL